MPRRSCSKEHCNHRIKKGRSYKDKDGSFICKDCYRSDGRLAQKEHEVAALKKTLDTKLKSVDKALQVIPSFLL